MTLHGNMVDYEVVIVSRHRQRPMMSKVFALFLSTSSYHLLFHSRVLINSGIPCIFYFLIRNYLYTQIALRY